MSAELTKLNTGGYNSGLDELMDNKVDVYLKAKLTKRLTYGEYVGEPNNGFELLIGDERKLLNLDNVEVFTCKDKLSLTDDQQVVLEWLKYPLNDIPNRFAENYFAYVTCLFLGQAPDKVLKAYQELSPEQQLEVLAAFAEWGMKNDQED